MSTTLVRVVVGALIVAGGPPPPGFAQAASPASPARPGAPRAPHRLVDLNADLQALAARVNPSVVQVLVTSYAQAGSDGAAVVLARQRGSGSGVIVDEAGHVVTNAHVVRGARTIEVLRSPRREGPGASILRPVGRPLPARVVGLDRETDLALLKVDAPGLVPMPFADPDGLRQGQLVLAFGSPLGLDNSVTLGVLSALARQLEPDAPMVYLQTDAPINPGSSGGPLVDVEGRLVGINTLILSQGGGNEGLGFAAPVHIVRSVVESLRAHGRMLRGWIGARVQTVTPLLAAGLALPEDATVIVADVVSATPAAQAGLRPGDVLASLDGRPLDNARQFDVRLYRARPGEVVRLELLRDGRRLQAEIPVVERPGDRDRFAAKVSPEKNLVSRLGILGIELDEAIRAALGGVRGEAGVLVAARAAAAPGGEEGPQVGDVIYAVNGLSVRGLVELRDAVGRAPAGGALVLQVVREGRLLYLAIEAE
jgi:serine protease Do